MRRVFWAAVLALAICSGRAQAQPPSSTVLEDGLECDYWSTLVFESSSAIVDLGAQADLNRALQWLFDAPGRYLFILGADGPQAADVRLGLVRASAVTSFLISNGAASGNLMRSDFSAVRTSRLQAGLRPDNVVVMNCEVAPLDQ